MISGGHSTAARNQDACCFFGRLQSFLEGEHKRTPAHEPVAASKERPVQAYLENKANLKPSRPYLQPSELEERGFLK